MSSRDPVLSDLLTLDLEPTDPMTEVLKHRLQQFEGEAQPNAGDDGMEVLAARLARPRQIRWKVRSLLAVVASLILVAAVLPELSFVIAWSTYREGPQWLENWGGTLIHRFVEPDALAQPRGGDDSTEDWCERARETYESQRESPAAYYLYCHILFRTTDKLPEDFDTVSNKLEPDNAIWPMLKAQVLMTQALINGRATKTRDPGLVAQSLSVLKEAAAKPYIDHHLQEVGRLWRSGLHPVTAIQVAALTPYVMDIRRELLHPATFTNTAFSLGVKSPMEPEKRADLFRTAGSLMARDALAGNYASDTPGREYGGSRPEVRICG